MTSGFLPTFYDKNLDLAPTTAATVLIFTSLSALISTPLVGHLSQRIGRRRTFALVGVPNLVALPLLYLALGGLDKNQIVGIAAFSVLLCLLANAAMAPVLVFLNERFPTRIRATGTSLSWNVGFALGGMTPTLVTALSGGVSNFPSTLAILLVIAGIIFLVGAVAVPETRGRFEDVEEPEERARRERERRRVQRAPARPVTQ
jgi:MFS family permease